MKSFIAVVFGSLVFFLASAIAFAQGMPQIPESLATEKTDEQKYNEEVRRQRDPAVALREARVLKEGLLAPSDADRVAFAEFLHTRNTGLIRLLPRELYDSEVYHTANPSRIRGGGSYYSFINLTHVYGYGSDIGLEQNHLMVGFAGAAYGMLTNLGDVWIEGITLTDPRANFLSSYEPPTLEPEARAEAQRFGVREGVTIDGLVYQRRLPVQENTTYLLRSIDYDRSDVLVALRVVKKDSDGSIIIAWKLLKEYRPPMLKRS